MTSRSVTTSADYLIEADVIMTMTSRGASTVGGVPTSTPPSISEWYNGNKGVLEATGSSSKPYEAITGEKRFYAGSGPSHYQDNEPDVYGAIIEDPRNNPAKSNLNSADEFGLLTSLLYRQSSQDAKM